MPIFPQKSLDEDEYEVCDTDERMLIQIQKDTMPIFMALVALFAHTNLIAYVLPERTAQKVKC